MLRLEGVTFRHLTAPRPSLHDVSLGVDPGEVVGLLGADDAGKTSLCLVAGGLAPRVVRGELRGRILIDGQDIAGRRLHELVSSVAVGMADPAAQLSSVHDSVFEEVAFGPANLGVPRAEVIERTWQALEGLGIGELAARHPAHLSAGQRQLVALGGLLAMRPGTVILDEPLAHLDSSATRLLLESVTRLADEGLGLLLTAARVGGLEEACGRLAVLREGRVVHDGPADEVLVDPRLPGAGVPEPPLRRLERLAAAAAEDAPDEAGAPAAGGPPARGPTTGGPPAPGHPVPDRHAPAIVRLDGVSFVHASGVRALDGVDLEVRGGETVALVGANGSGKTTLLLHLVGLLRPRAGRLWVAGTEAGRQRVAQLAATVGLCLSDPDAQIQGRRVRDEVAFGPRNLGRDASRLGPAIEGALSATGLSGLAEQHPGDLGPSRRRLLTLASILAMETPCVALDEPTVGLDAAARERVAAVVHDLVAAGRAVILASQDIDFVAECATRVIVLRDGRVVLEGAPAEVFAEARWPILSACGLAPPSAALAGVGLGLGATPTEAALVAAARAVARGREPRGAGGERRRAGRGAQVRTSDPRTATGA